MENEAEHCMMKPEEELCIQLVYTVDTHSRRQEKYKFCTLIVECKSNLTPPDMVFSIPACHIGVVGVLNSSQLKSPS